VCGVADEGDAALGADPGGEGVAEDKFPVDEGVLGGRADDGVADGGPVGDGGDGFVDVTWC
jgi:hypothetical protein